jgi:hypothetical protein
METIRPPTWATCSYNEPYQSEFEIHPAAFKLRGSEPEDGLRHHTNWGLKCNITRQEGLLNLTRNAEQAWQVSASAFLENMIAIRAPLAAWQYALNYHAPASTIAGLGPPIGLTATEDGPYSFNWTTYVLNYLYASGEAQRITF